VALTRGEDGAFAAERLSAQTSTRVSLARGEMDGDSFYTSAVAAGVNDALIPEFAAAFVYDFDFQREIQRGDTFEAAFQETVNADGEPLGARRLLYVALNTRAKRRAFYRFTPPGGEAGWYDGRGRSIRRALLRTPVDGARVSSNFGPRTHPIQGFVKMHNGTDFAAPTGTKVYAAADATVEFAACKGGNGNFVRLRHDDGKLTYYLHLHDFAEPIQLGPTCASKGAVANRPPGPGPRQTRVRQGEVIGFVGTTGSSTGPHLHYELRTEAGPIDPLTVVTAEPPRLAPAALAAFFKVRDDVDRARASPG
jgi:murein DD-endopeptidase MepM/ murein hydrolase activator NlpD